MILDADAIVHELQQPGTDVYQQMVDLFGPDCCLPDGTFNRQWIADRVFSDSETLASLNAIVHPAVRNEMAQRVLALVETDAIAIMDVPLLTESGMQGMSGIIVVDVDPEIAVRRLVEGRGFVEADARARIAKQASREERLSRADIVVDNSGDLDALKPQIDKIWAWAQGLAAAAASGDASPSAGTISFEKPAAGAVDKSGD